jgi:hypothetical protein
MPVAVKRKSESWTGGVRQREGDESHSKEGRNQEQETTRDEQAQTHAVTRNEFGLDTVNGLVAFLTFERIFRP